MESEKIICARNELKKVKSLYTEYQRLVNDINVSKLFTYQTGQSELQFIYEIISHFILRLNSAYTI